MSLHRPITQATPFYLQFFLYFDPSALTPEKDETMRVIQDGILRGGDFTLPLTDQAAGETEGE